MTIYGITTYPRLDVQDSHRALYGDFGYTRFFYGVGVRYGWNRGPLKFYRRPDTAVVSVKTFREDDFAAMLAGADGSWVFAIRHEMEDDLARGEITLEQILEWYRRAKAMRDAFTGPWSCSLAVILNSYQLTIAGFDPRRLTPILALADVVGVDSYTYGEAVKKTGLYPPPEEFWTPLVTVGKLTGLPIAAPEMGVHLAPDGDDARRADAIRGYVHAASRLGLLWASYWCHPGGSGFHLDDPAVSGESLAVWRAAVAATARPRP